tara:strand:- start:550 stop:738 length:189 start_codon:yes stop_codon:yes gene_type:complete
MNNRELKIQIENMLKHITSNREKHFEWLKVFAGYISVHHTKVGDEAEEYADEYMMLNEVLKK